MKRAVHHGLPVIVEYGPVCPADSDVACARKSIHSARRAGAP